MTENMERGAYLAQSKSIQQLNVPAIQAIRQLYDRGVAAKVFRPGLDPIDIHASISALTFFNVSNQHTFGLIFKRDAQSARGPRRAPRQHHRDGAAFCARLRAGPLKGKSGFVRKLTSSYIMMARALSRLPACPVMTAAVRSPGRDATPICWRHP